MDVVNTLVLMRKNKLPQVHSITYPSDFKALHAFLEARGQSHTNVVKFVS